MKNYFKNKYYGYKWYNWLIYILCILIFLISFIFPIVPLVISIIVLLLFAYYSLENMRFIKHCTGNGIVYGSRGSGKGILFQKRINKDKKAFSNVDYGKHVEIINVKEYIESIAPNTIINVINDDIRKVLKILKYEGINVYVDDVTTLFPNFEDNILKKLFPAMPLTLAINRHLYGAFMLINVQSANRPYKILRELQADFSIKALKTSGWGVLWRSIPILRNYASVKYRYYEEEKAREEGVRPFKAKAILNETTKHAYLTSGQATKEDFNARYGKVFESRIFIAKKRLYYDTRYFHKVFFGFDAPKSF